MQGTMIDAVVHGMARFAATVARSRCRRNTTGRRQTVRLRHSNDLPFPDQSMRAQNAY